MSKPQSLEVFENEEAAKLLDYFAAYKKLQNKIEQIKCMAAVNSEICLTANQPQEPTPLNDLIDNQPEALLPSALEK